MLLPESCKWKSERPVCNIARLGMQMAPWVPQGMCACVNVFIAEAANRVESLIVCKYHEYVGFAHVLVPTGGRRLDSFG